ncbi:MAG: S41 family peptidase [Pseudomonadales bacterium]
MQLRPLTLIGIVISMVTGITLGIVSYHAWLEQHWESAEARTFDEVLHQVQSSYVDEVARAELMNNALRGMLDHLDDHSNFLDARELHELQEETTGRFGGIGIELGLVDDLFTVISPLDHTPASHAGLQPGDRILELDHQSLLGRTLMEVVDALRGEPGSEIHLRIRRDKRDFDVQIERAVIEVASVTGRLLEPGFGLVRISQFQNATGEEFDKALQSLVEDNGAPLEGLVLDLRNNPGGVLQASVDVTDAFLKEGLIVYTEGRLPSSHLKYRASGRDLLDGAPVVVLINEGSASAAEIVAGALQDHARAQLLGSRSYGKGSVQSVMPISGDNALKLTTAYYYTPRGRSIHKTGIEPDVLAQAGDIPEEAESRLLEQALSMLKAAQPASSGALHARL